LVNKKTVFILGAGASAECKMPLGDELKTLIEKAILHRDPNFWTVVYNQWLKGITNVTDYENGADELAATLSTTPFASIDEALHWWRDWKEIVDLGKLAIAYFILRDERRSWLQFRDDRTVDVDKVKDTWFAEFMSLGIRELERGQIINAFENVTIINFNYDRTIEHYLYHALQQRARVSMQAAKDAIARMTVIRPYGRIGPLEWQQPDGIPFGGSDDTLYEAVTAMKSIRTFTEQIEGSPILDDIRKALDEAQLMIILGFGFHPQNMQLFDAKHNRNAGSPIVTVFNLDERNYEAIAARLKGSAKIIADPLWLNLKCAEAMSKLRLRILMAAA
jgi:hypothetical protein